LIPNTKAQKKYEIKPPSHLGEGMGEGLIGGQQYAHPRLGGNQKFIVKSPLKSSFVMPK